MNLYHAAALALIGWYPMAPPRESKTSGLHSGAAELSAAAIVAAAESMVGPLSPIRAISSDEDYLDRGSYPDRGWRKPDRIKDIDHPTK
jgi:hypothetical protein